MIRPPYFQRAEVVSKIIVRSVCYLFVQDPDLELVVLEHLLQVRLLHDEPLEGLLLLRDFLNQLLQDREVVVGNL